MSSGKDLKTIFSIVVSTVGLIVLLCMLGFAKETFRIIIIVLASIIGFVLLIVLIRFIYKKHKEYFVPHKYVGFNAFGKSYSNAKTERYFFEHISQEKVDAIYSHIIEIQKWKNKIISELSSSKKVNKFNKKYERRKQEAFRCEIYRRPMKYEQKDYVKTSYRGHVTYWENVYDIEQMDKTLTRYDRFCSLPEYYDSTEKE